jgi:nucleoside 2-deoxyribosyltransferase
MGKCFAIQPFDNDKFDKRFKDTYKPAIEECDLEAYRVDKDPKSQIPIDDIDIQIKTADICLAEITTDNPNVWFELGLAIAYDKSVVMLCSDERLGNFPFDVQHRSIIKYLTGSSSDFINLKEKIKEKIKALSQIQKNRKSELTMTSVKTTDGLESHEVDVLVAIASSIDGPNDSVSFYSLKDSLEKIGLTRVGITLGIKRLSSLDFIEFSINQDYNGNEFHAYKITDKGMNWLMDNKDKFVLKNADTSASGVAGDSIDF